MKKKVLRAVDLYSGVGGWSLGLRMAGIEIVASYDRWAPANETNFRNNRHQAQTVDIRTMELVNLPSNIDVVVGSPPCTQFSFSNRGGRGDITDGLEDIIKFLTVVDYLKPRSWAMENVPRVASILDEELQQGGRLACFTHLGLSHHVVNMEEFGLPQRRHRCIAGNINFKLLKSYANRVKAGTLGDVINVLSSHEVTDPIYGFRVKKEKLSDHEPEEFLNEEEARINRANKLVHPIYNSMPFPDPLERSVRTITATCTRVSRESIVIENPANKGVYRRLTLRERATLQGFPIVFQFYGNSYGQKLKMIGNAIPPVLSYYVGLAMRGVQPDEVLSTREAVSSFEWPSYPAASTPPVRPISARYPRQRTFRFAIPSLRLKSGVRFELFNQFREQQAYWRVAFIFGTSKSIHGVELGAPLLGRLRTRLHRTDAIEEELDKLRTFLLEADIAHLQDLWSHTGPGTTRPFMILDELDRAGRQLSMLLKEREAAAAELVAEAVTHQHGAGASALKGLDKLQRNAPVILAGLLVGSLANAEFKSRETQSSYRRRLQVS